MAALLTRPVALTMDSCDDPDDGGGYSDLSEIEIMGLALAVPNVAEAVVEMKEEESHWPTLAGVEIAASDKFPHDKISAITKLKTGNRIGPVRHPSQQRSPWWHVDRNGRQRFTQRRRDEQGRLCELPDPTCGSTGGSCRSDFVPGDR